VQITKLKIESNPFAKGFRDSASSEYFDQNGHDFSTTMDAARLAAQHHHQQQQQQSHNSRNLMLEKARFLLMCRPLFPGPELLACIQAASAASTAGGLGVYSPALLAAALRPQLASSDRAPLGRFSPYPSPSRSSSPPSPRDQGALGSSSSSSSCRPPPSPPASPPTTGLPPLLLPIYRRDRPPFPLLG
jgi:hypothetical protein